MIEEFDVFRDVMASKSKADLLPEDLLSAQLLKCPDGYEVKVCLRNNDGITVEYRKCGATIESAIQTVLAATGICQP